MIKNTDRFVWAELIGFFRSKLFHFTLLRLAAFFVLLWVLHSLLLNIYTNHGQKIKLAKFEGMDLRSVSRKASVKGFQLVVVDSVFVLRKPGGIIVSQVPKPGSIVKRGRSVYVTVSRYTAETFSSDRLPDLYGKKYEHSKAELYNRFELHSRIAGTKFDPGQEAHVLEVYYKGTLLCNDTVNNKNILLQKGDTLDFIISSNKDGQITVPDLDCKTLAEAKFIIAASKLSTGKILFDGPLTDEDLLFVVDQKPAFNEKILIGDEVHLSVSKVKPDRCQ